MLYLEVVDMRRTMVFLRDDQFNTISNLSKTFNKSMADIIRESLDAFLVSKKVNHWQYSHLDKIIGLGKSKAKNRASVEHDKHLYK